MVSHVEAIFDFYGQDDSQLSFKKGDHIQVISRLNSGWWDGICKGKRGWFPSNMLLKPILRKTKPVPWIPQLDAQGKQYYVDSKTKEASYYPIMKNLNEKVSNSGMEPLPRNWGIKYTHDSKPYYYNKETDETCWSLDEINLETGLLKKRSNSNSFGSINEEISYSTSPKAGELTWEKISNDIYYCLQQLYKSARLNKKESYISHSASIVETIRTMLYASNTAKRDCQIFTNNKALKQLYRHIMDSLSELVVTTKTAHKFGHHQMLYQKCNRLPTMYILALKTLLKLKVHKKLNKTVRTQENVSSELIITETRNIVIDVGDFLTVIDEINYDMLNNEIVVDFKTNRLTVCNRIYGLVMTTQNIVNTLRPSNFEEQILLSTELIEKAIKELVISTKCLLQEKENVDQYQKIYYDYNRRASASSEASLVNSSASSNDTNNFSSPATMSMDVPDTEYPDFEENGQARNRTFSQRSLPSKLTENFNNMYITNPHPHLLFNMDGKVKGGTFEALVERLTCHDSFDANFTNTFLLTYRSFCTTIQFMSELLKRYLLPQPAGLTDINEVNEWHEKKLKPIRLRVCNVVKSWLEYAIETDEEDQKAFNMAKEFFDRQIQSDPTFLTVSKLLDRFDKAGFSSAPIHRLRRTWDFLSNKNIATLDSLNKTMDRNKNFSTYREQLHSVNPPCVPFLGVYLTDLTFIDDGNSNNLKNADGEVNE
ncbi:ras GEF, partial [Piromyces finnis]